MLKPITFYNLILIKTTIILNELPYLKFGFTYKSNNMVDSGIVHVVGFYYKVFRFFYYWEVFTITILKN
jgi:hypothetical protein